MPKTVAVLWLYFAFCTKMQTLRRGFASAEATKGLSDRPLETFGFAPMLLGLWRRRGTRLRARKENRTLGAKRYAKKTDEIHKMGFFH